MLERHPLKEADGYYWVWMGPGSPEPPEPTPVLPELGAPEHQVLKIRMEGDFRLRDILDNLLDVTHVPFVHVFPHLPADRRALLVRVLDIRSHATGVTLLGGPADDREGAAAVLGDVEVRIAYSHPSTVRLDFPKAGPGQARTMVAHFAPRDPRHTICEFVIVFVSPGAPSHVVRIDHGDATDPFFTAGRLLDEDFVLVRAQQRTGGDDPSPTGLVVSSDALVAACRAFVPGPQGASLETRRVVISRCGFEAETWPPTA